MILQTLIVSKYDCCFLLRFMAANIDLLQTHHRKLTTHLHKHIQTHNILIGCADGLSISPLIIAIYILHYGKMDPKSIYQMLQTKDSQLSLWCDLSCFQ